MQRMIAPQEKMKAQTFVKVIGLAGCGITQTFKAGGEMKIEGRRRDKLHFEGEVWDRGAACGMVSE